MWKGLKDPQANAGSGCVSLAFVAAAWFVQVSVAYC